jgi:hypothetical protein
LAKEKMIGSIFSLFLPMIPDFALSWVIMGSGTLTVADFTHRYREGKMFVSLWPGVAADTTTSSFWNPDPLAMMLGIEVNTIILFESFSSLALTSCCS